MKHILLFSLFFSCLLAKAQKEDYQWLLGGSSSTFSEVYKSVTLDFNDTPVSIVFYNKNRPYVRHNTSICDRNGQLLYYSNGESLYNRDDDIVKNGEALVQGSWHDTGFPLPQTQLMLWMPDAPNKIMLVGGDYFIYPEPTYNTNFGCTFGYSMIDTEANGGAGEVVEKGRVILSDTLMMGQFTAARHANGRDWWVLAPHAEANWRYRFLLSPAGLRYVGRQPYPNILGSLGQSVFSPDGSWYATYQWLGLLSNSFNRVELFRFDRCTGLLSERIAKDFPQRGAPGGVAFSPDGRLLYVSKWDKVYQYDLNAPDIFASETTVATYDGFIDEKGDPTRFYHLLLAPDGKIYFSVSNYNSRYLHVIEKPNERGAACAVRQHAIFLPVYNNFVIPNLPNPRLGNLLGSPCDTLNLSSATGGPHQSAGILAAELFPNPATEVVTLRLSKPLETESTLTLWNATGQAVWQQTLPPGTQAQSFDIGTLPKGFYTYTLRNGQQSLLRDVLIVLR